MSFGQSVFSIQKSKFGKIRFLVYGKICKSQKWFKKFEIFHTSLYINALCQNYFCGFLRNLWDFLEIKIPSFSVLECLLPGSGGRPGRSIGPRVDRPDQSTDVHKDVHADQPLGPVDRLQVPHSRVGAVDRTVDHEQGTVDRAVDRPESNLLSGLARSTGRSTGRLNGQKFDCWPVDRKANSGLVSSQWADFSMGYEYPI